MASVVHQLAAFVEKQPPPVALAVAALVTSILVSVHVLRTIFARPTSSSGYINLRPASSLPLLNNTLDVMFVHRARLYDWITDQCVALGGRPWLCCVVGSAPVVTLCTPALFEDVLQTQFDKFERGSAAHFRDLFGRGILASDGDAWAFHRKTVSHLFSNRMVRDVMYEAVHAKIETLCAVLRGYEAKSQPVSFKSVIKHFTSDVFGQIGFGVDLRCLESGARGDRKGNAFVNAFATATHAILERFMAPTWLWQLKRRLDVGAERKNRESREVIDAFIFRILDESITKKQQQQQNSSPNNNDDETATAPRDLISLCLRSSSAQENEHLEGRAFDSEAHLIRDTVVNFIFAGNDTTAHSMGFFVLMMNRHPAVLAKIRVELSDKLPRTADGRSAVPTMDELPQLTYLEAAIRENLRLNPTVALVPRQAKCDVTLCDGTRLQRGARLSLAVYAAGRMEETWGHDALEFKPERWLDATTGKLLALSAFIGGRRNCIGRKFALLEIKCALAVLLGNFELSTLEDPWTLTYEPGLTVSVKGPLMVSVSSLVAGTAAAGADAEPASSA